MSTRQMRNHRSAEEVVREINDQLLHLEEEGLVECVP